MSIKETLKRYVVVVGLALPGCSPQREPEVVEGRPRDPLAKSGGAVSGAEAAADERDIRALFDRYWEGLAKSRGEQAVACIDAKTLESYESVRKDALYMTREELSKQDLRRRLAILQFRHEFDQQTLTRCTARELLARGFSMGWGRFAQEKVALGYIGSNGKSAHAIKDRGPDVPSFFFEKESDGWKVNETKLHDVALTKLKTLQAQSGHDESKFLIKYVSESSGRKPDERIFDGPLDKIPG